MKKVLTWQQAIKSIDADVDLSQKDLSCLVTYARKAGVGEEITFQKTKYSEDDLVKLNKIIVWWDYLNSHTAEEWRDKTTSIKMQKILCSAVSQNKTINIYSIFCPSYKKGKGAFGYTGVTGEHTKSKIHELEKFINDSVSLGINIKAYIYFSDLLLENYSKLKDTNYKTDLENNYQDFKNRFKSKYVEVSRLSDIDDLNQKIGEQGVVDKEIKLPTNIYQRVLERNTAFYGESLRWNDNEIKKRTDILVNSYQALGDYFRKQFPDGVVYWVESAYERGVMYSGENQADPIPIIYPNKNE